MAAYTSIGSGNWSAESTWHAGGPTTNYLVPGIPQPITNTLSGTGGGVRVTLTNTPSVGTAWVAGDIAKITGVSTGTEANGLWAAVNVSGATFEIVPIFAHTYVSGGSAVRTSDSATSTITNATASSGGIRLTFSGVATTWAIGDVVTVTGVTGTTEANGVWVVRAATNVTNSTVDLAVKYVAAGSGGSVTRGDSVTISGFDTVTVDTSVAIGDNSTNAMLTAGNDATIIIGSSATLSVRGEIYVGSGTMTLSKNCILEWGSTNGTAYFRQTVDHYTINCAGGGNAPNANNRATIRKISGATLIIPAPYYRCTYNLSYVDYENVGNASFSCADPGYFGSTGRDFIFNYCRFTNCGPLGITSSDCADTAGAQNVDHCRFITPAGTTAVIWRFTGISTGLRNFTNNVVEGDFDGRQTADLNVAHNDFHGGLTGSGFADGTIAFEDNLLRFNYAHSGMTLGGDILNCYVVADPQINPHYFYGSNNMPTTWDGCVVECPLCPEGDSGDFILGGEGTASLHLKKAIRCIILPISTGVPTDTFPTKGVPSATVHTIFGSLPYDRRSTVHCTIVASDNGGHGCVAQLGEGTSPVAGNLQEVKSNLIWSYGPGDTGNNTASQYAVLTPTTQVDNAMVPSGVSHNGLFNVLVVSAPGKTNDGTAYATNTTGSAPGVNDIVGQDPVFVDRRRCLVKWGRTLIGDLGSGVNYSGATYTDAQIIDQVWAAMKLKNEPGFDSRFTHAALMEYVKDGFAPTNAVYQDAGHDSVTIGAVEGVFGSTPATGYSFTGPSSGTVNVASTNFTVTLTPSGGTASSTTITPASTVAGTFSPTTVSLSTGSPSATFTFTPSTTSGSPSTISVTNSGSLTNPSSLSYTVNSAAATGYSLTGPTHETIGSTSSNFTVTLTPSGGTASSTTITPASTTSGTFSPTTVTLSTGSPSATFTFTPTSNAGSPATISCTNSGSLTNPSSLVFTITTTVYGCLTIIEAVSQSYPSLTIKSNDGSHVYFQMFADGSIGHGNVNVPSASSAIPAWFEEIHTNTTVNTHGLAITSSRVTTENPSIVTQTTGLLLQTSRTNIYSDVIDTGRLTGISAYAWRNEPDDAGFLDWSEALEFVYGHGNLPDNTIHTGTVCGIRLVPAINLGTIDVMYDLYISTIQSGGTVGSHYPIYQEQTGLSNYFGSTIDTNSIKLRTGATVGSYLVCNNVDGSSSWSGMKPAHMGDSSAVNDLIYFSTTSGKLCYKDNSGVSHNLY